MDIMADRFFHFIGNNIYYAVTIKMFSHMIGYRLFLNVYIINKSHFHCKDCSLDWIHCVCFFSGHSTRVLLFTCNPPLPVTWAGPSLDFSGEKDGYTHNSIKNKTCQNVNEQFSGIDGHLSQFSRLPSIAMNAVRMVMTRTHWADDCLSWRQQGEHRVPWMESTVTYPWPRRALEDIGYG